MDVLGAVGLLKSAMEGVRSAIGLAKDAKDLAGGVETGGDLAAQRSRLLDDLVKVQTELLALQETLFGMRDEIEEYDRFQQRADRYELRKTEAGGLVYTLKADAQPPQPMHDICPACYANRKTAILQPRGILLTCTVCKADVPNLPPPNVVTTVRGHF